MARDKTLHESAPEYRGVIASGDDFRLAVSARGAAYLTQERDGDIWRRARSFPNAATLRAWFAVVYLDGGDELEAAVSRLPSDPSEYWAVPFQQNVKAPPRPSRRKGAVDPAKRRARRQDVPR